MLNSWTRKYKNSIFASMTNCRISHTALIHRQTENIALEGCLNVVNASNQDVVLWPLYLSDLSATVSDVLALNRMSLHGGRNLFFRYRFKSASNHAAPFGSWNWSDRQQSSWSFYPTCPSFVLHFSFFSLSSFLAEETENHSVSFCFVLGSWRAGRETWMVSPVLCIQSCTPSSTSHVIAKNTPLHWNQDGNMDPPALSNTSICKHTGSYRPFWSLLNPCKSFWSLLIPLVAISQWLPIQ